MTRADIERAVEDLFTGENGEQAVRLLMLSYEYENLGALSQSGVVERLCKSLGIEETGEGET